MRRKAVVVDIDGVLFDVTDRFWRCVDECNGVGYDSYDRSNTANVHDIFHERSQVRCFWDCFLSDRYMDLDRINDEILDMIRERKKEGYMIILLSGRREDTQGKKTREQLKEHSVPYDMLILRQPGDFREDSVIKGEALDRLYSEGIEVVEFYDDRMPNIMMARLKIPWARIVHYSIGR